MDIATQTRRHTDADPAGRAGKYLIFQLGAEEYGVAVMKVREIMGMQEITAVPQMPESLVGVMNLRGKVVPVVDLRLRFGLDRAPYNSRTCIIVARTLQQGEDLSVGMVVDGVAEVLTLSAADIEDAPDFGSGTPAPYLRGLAKNKGRVKILLDIDEVLSAGELPGLSALLQ